MNKLLLFVSCVLMTACSSHSIKLKGTHFASPVTSDKLWSGKATLSASSNTEVTLVRNITTTPPTLGTITFNDDVNELGLSNPLSLEASLGLLAGTEIFLDGTLLGLRWQFLNHGEQTDVWVASLQGATGSSEHSKSEDNGTTNPKATTKLNTKQVGGSIGYKFPEVVLYASYISENHSAKTSVTNNGTTYGDYEDKGNHHYYSVGVSSFKRGFTFGLEYSHILLGWGRSDKGSQDAVGGRIGFVW